MNTAFRNLVNLLGHADLAHLFAVGLIEQEKQFKMTHDGYFACSKHCQKQSDSDREIKFNTANMGTAIHKYFEKLVKTAIDKDLYRNICATTEVFLSNGQWRGHIDCLLVNSTKQEILIVDYKTTTTYHQPNIPHPLAVEQIYRYGALLMKKLNYALLVESGYRFRGLLVYINRDGNGYVKPMGWSHLFDLEPDRLATTLKKMDTTRNDSLLEDDLRLKCKQTKWYYPCQYCSTICKHNTNTKLRGEDFELKTASEYVMPKVLPAKPTRSLTSTRRLSNIRNALKKQSETDKVA